MRFRSIRCVRVRVCRDLVLSTSFVNASSGSCVDVCVDSLLDTLANAQRLVNATRRLSLGRCLAP